MVSRRRRKTADIIKSSQQQQSPASDQPRNKSGNKSQEKSQNKSGDSPADDFVMVADEELMDVEEQPGSPQNESPEEPMRVDQDAGVESMEVDQVPMDEAQEAGGGSRVNKHKQHKSKATKRKSVYLDDKAEVDDSDEDDSDEYDSSEEDGEEDGEEGEEQEDADEPHDADRDADSARVLQEKLAKKDDKAKFDKMAEATKRRSRMYSQAQQFMKEPIATDQRQWNYLHQDSDDNNANNNNNNGNNRSALNRLNGGNRGGSYCHAGGDSMGTLGKVPSMTEMKHVHHTDNVAIDDDEEDEYAIMAAAVEDDYMSAVEDLPARNNMACQNPSDVYIPKHVSGECFGETYKNIHRKPVNCGEMKVVIQFTHGEIVDVFVVPSRPIEASHMDPSFLQLMPGVQFPRLSRCMVEIGWKDDGSKLHRLNRLAPFVRATYKGNKPKTTSEESMHCQVMEQLDLNNNPNKMYIFRVMDKWFRDAISATGIEFSLSPKFPGKPE